MDPEFWSCAILEPKWVHLLKRIFFQKTDLNLVPIMPICVAKINVRYQSINEILTIKDYWNLIGQKSFLAITWEPDFSQACSFRRMLKNHKNFFTGIPDKSNDLIFLENTKTFYCGPLWALVTSFFSKKSRSFTYN